VVEFKNRFCNKHINTLDAKNRVFVPSEYREILGPEFMLTPGEEKNLNLYTLEAWDNYIQKLEQLPTNKQINRQIMRYYTTNAVKCSLDAQGRIVIPQNLLKKAELVKEVLFAGVNNRVEIWNPEIYKSEAVPDDISALLEQLPDGINL